MITKNLSMLLILTAVAAAPTEPSRLLPRASSNLFAEVSEQAEAATELPPIVITEEILEDVPAQLPGQNTPESSQAAPAPADLPDALQTVPDAPNTLGDGAAQPDLPESVPLAGATPSPANEAPPQLPDAVEVFRTSFEDENDADWNGWPDGWSRKRGPGFPWYLRIGMEPGVAQDGAQALAVQLNGGAAAVYSPPIDVHAEFSYLLHAHVKTVNLHHDHATVSVTFFDAAGSVVERFESHPVGHTTDWQLVKLGPLAAKSATVRQAVIGLHVTPGGKSDLKGSVYFDNLWLGRLPRMSFDSNRAHNVYALGEQAELTCEISGIFDANPVVVFQLFDIDGRVTLSQSQQLQVTAVGEDEDENEAQLEVSLTESAGLHCRAAWLPQVDKPGFYRACATLQGQNGTLLKREQTLAYFTPGTLNPSGEFGWSLPHGTDPLSLASLEKLLPNMGINWVKLPLWASENDNEELDRLVTFAERMSQRGIETVGLLTEPPAAVRSKFGNLTQPTAADIFSTEPDLWYPLLEPVMARLSLQVRWWQLGTDDDVSFVGYRKLLPTLAKVKAELQRFGQEVNLGMGWRLFDEPVVTAKRPAWDYLSLTAEPQPTAAEIAAYLPQFNPHNARRWVSLKPLSAEHYSLSARTGDLVHRMLASKMAGAEAIFLNDPFHPKHGLMRQNGTPGELLLPWRTTAQVLAGASYLGSLRLPQGSANHLFERAGQVTMIAWSTSPVRETFYLGSDLTAVDVWGRQTAVPSQDGACRVDLGPMPVFLQGIHPAIVRWNLATDFRRHALPSVFGTAHENALKVTNTFPQGVGVKARFNFADSWKVVPRLLDFKLAMGEEAEQVFDIALPYDASSGKHRVQIDFEVQAEQRYQFSVFREINVGQDDILIEATAQLNDKGELEVEQIVTNRDSKPVSFKCFLFVPDRRRLMTQVIQLSADRDRKLYRLPNGEELIGKTLWLRAEEMGGNRTLNRQLVVTE